MAFDRIHVRAALEATLSRPCISHSEFLAELRQDFPRSQRRIDELIDTAEQDPQSLHSREGNERDFLRSREGKERNSVADC